MCITCVEQVYHMSATHVAHMYSYTCDECVGSTPWLHM